MTLVYKLVLRLIRKSLDESSTVSILDPTIPSLFIKLIQATLLHFLFPCSPFLVSPSVATLEVNACMQINIGFTPAKIGDHSGELVLRYDTEEEVYTQLYGSARDVNVRLDRSSITMEDTFIGLSSQRLVVLHNRSDVVVHFEWKAFASEMEEDVQKEM